MSVKFTTPPVEDSDAFLEGKRSVRLPLGYNDIVSIRSGTQKGEEGWVVGLIESVPEARYTVELCSGHGDLYLQLSEIELIIQNENQGA